MALFLSLWVATPALALHETEHRYDITGYVLGADEQPISGVSVVAHMDNKPVGSGRSDSNGHYRFRLHLHDSDVGRELRIKTPESQGTVRVTLTPGDKSTQRIHYVNFIGGKLVEGEQGGRGGVSRAAMTAAAVGVVLLGGIFAARHFRRARRRRMRAEQKAAKGKGPGRSKRRTRGKRRG